MITVRNGLSCKMSNMRFLCAVMIAITHCGRPADVGSAPWWFFSLVADGVVRIGVPFFFVASGFFLAGHVNKISWWKDEVAKRVTTLLIPYLIWNTLMGVFLIVISTVRSVVESGSINWDLVLSQLGNAWSWYGLNPMDNPVLGPFWYIRALYVLVLVSPVILFFVKKTPWLIIVGSWILACVVFPEQDGLGPFRATFLRHCFSPVGVAYFSLGMYLRLNDICCSFNKRMFAFSLAVMISATCFKTKLLYTGESFGIGVVEASIPFMMYVVWSVMPSKPIPCNLSAYSFPMYTLHIFMISLMYSASYYFSFGPNWNPVFGILWGTVGSILVASLLMRLFPKMSKVSFGGR